MQIPNASVLAEQIDALEQQSAELSDEADAEASVGIANELKKIQQMLAEHGDELIAPDTGVREIALDALRPGPRLRQPTDADEIESLAGSIRQHGLLQPLLVRPLGGDSYEIVCGERRWRAAQVAGLEALPAVVRDFGEDSGVLVAGLVENLERRELTALEEAEGFRRLVDEFELTQENLAKLIGKSRSAIANTLRLLDAPDAVREALQAGAITAGHARALMSSPAAVKLLKQVIKHGLSVRETERLANRSGQGPAATLAPGEEEFDVAFLQQVVTDLLGLRATLKRKGEAGTITLHYADFEQLDSFLTRLHALEGETETDDAAPAGAA